MDYIRETEIIMKTQQNISSIFYQHLGKLFYAIAMADGKIGDQEYEKLKSMIEREWFFINHTFAEGIESIFSQLQKENAKAGECYEAFVIFKNEHPDLFTNDIKSMIIKTANKIAASFSGVNKSELILLAKLDMELKK